MCSKTQTSALEFIVNTSWLAISVQTQIPYFSVRRVIIEATQRIAKGLAGEAEFSPEIWDACVFYSENEKFLNA